MKDITAVEVFVYRYRYNPTSEQRDQTRLREIELTLKAVEVLRKVKYEV